MVVQPKPFEGEKMEGPTGVVGGLVGGWMGPGQPPTGLDVGVADNFLPQQFYLKKNMVKMLGKCIF